MSVPLPVVLLVGRDAVLAGGIATALESRGSAVHRSADTAGASDALARGTGDVVLVDLPPRDAAFGQLASVWVAAGGRPVLALVGDDTPPIERRLAAGMGVELIAKPFGLEELFHRLATRTGRVRS
jgi:DNA-binding response OmpR family regulator